MAVTGRKDRSWTLTALLCALAALFIPVRGQEASPLTETGQITLHGKKAPYRIRHLPVSSFPEMPPALATLLTQRSCLIPQTYQARGPENVIHGSFEGPGSSDWAVLCSQEGTVSLLVYFESAPGKLQLLASAPETERLQAHDVTGLLGFDWGIDPASPEQVREARAGMDHRPPPTGHDALAETIINRQTIYHYFMDHAWTELDMPNE